MEQSKQKLCPKCLGAQTLFDGTSVKNCNLCDGSGEVDINIKYNPIEDEINDRFDTL